MFIFLLTTFVVGLILYWLVTKYFNQNESFCSKLGIKEAKPSGLFKTFFDKESTFVSNEMHLYDQLRGEKIGGFVEATVPIFYVLDLDIMKHIYIKDFDNFVNRRTLNMEHDPHLHLSLFNLEGQPWRQIRTKTSPAFTTGKIKRMFQTFDSSSHKLVTALKGDIPQGQKKLEIRPYIQNFTMDVIASVAFGIETNLFQEKDSRFTKMSSKLTTLFAGFNIFKLFLIVMAPKLGSLLRLRFIDNHTDKFFSSMVISCLKQRIRTGEKREDFLQLMLEARNEMQGQDGVKEGQLDLSDDVIIAQCFGFVLGGFDTSETLVAWLLYSLACNPDIQEKLYVEMKGLEDDNGQLNYDDITKAEYLDKVLSETLRMYPPATRTERKSTQDYKIPGMDVTLPKNSIVALPIYPVHHDPEYWPNPSEFDPERFTKENVAKRHSCAYIPFGAGPRMCIAMRFALVEAKVVMAHLVTNFKFETCEKTLIPPVFANDATLKIKDNMWLNVTVR